MCRVGSEDCDGIAGLEGVDGRLVCIGILLIVGGERVERGVEAVVDLGNVLLQMLPWGTFSTESFGDAGLRRNLRIAGNLVPLTPAMPSWLTLPRRRRSNRVRPTTPTFLSEPEAPVPTKPVVYSPVPIFYLIRMGLEYCFGQDIPLKRLEELPW
jgi:hypothetical protein